MKRYIMTLGFLALAVIAKADAGFLKTLPAEDLAAAGLNKLTPDELARLEALVQRYKVGEVSVVRQQAEAKALVSQKEAEQKVIAAETKVREAEAKANEAALQAKDAGVKATTGPAKKQPGWFTALITLNRAGEKPEKEEPLEGRLVGNFAGWNGHTIFTLEDGTRWVQQNKSETYAYAPVLRSPKVKIRPAALRGFWLEIEGVNLNVRVIPFELTDRK